MAIFLIAGCILVVLALQGQQIKQASESNATDASVQKSIADYSDKRIGVMSGSIYENIVKKTMPDASISFFDKASDMADAI